MIMYFPELCIITEKEHQCKCWKVGKCLNKWYNNYINDYQANIIFQIIFNDMGKHNNRRMDVLKWHFEN